MAGFESGLLGRIAEADEVEVESHRSDGSARRTIIWVVVDGDRAYVRSIKGGRGVWYREMRNDAETALHVGGERVPVQAVAVDDPGEIARVTDAYQRKYGRSPWLKGVVSEVSLSGTLWLEPRGQ